MAEIEITLDVTSLNRALRRYQVKTQNLPMDSFANLLLQEAEEMFASEGASGAEGAWRPLSPVTFKRNPRRIGGMILQATGATANIQVKEIAAFSVTVESPTAYAHFHLSGTDAMPRRDFFAFKFPKLLDAMADLVLQEYQR